MPQILPYQPGTLPSRAPPDPGEHLQFEVDGLPPIKDLSRSVRNRTHPLHGRFVELRRVATLAMDGRAWVFAKVGLEMVVRSAPDAESCGLVDYLSGVMDTLGGSAGRTFTFLPIVYQDDCQVDGAEIRWEESERASYSVCVLFK
jgi:hypothetical protein